MQGRREVRQQCVAEPAAVWASPSVIEARGPAALRYAVPHGYAATDSWAGPDRTAHDAFGAVMPDPSAAIDPTRRAPDTMRAGTCNATLQPKAHPLQSYLDSLVAHYEQPAFVDSDPIAACHGFADPRDQEVIGLYAAILAWGRRATVLDKLMELCERMRQQPYRFVRDFDRLRDADMLDGFKHRTFTSGDAIWFTANLSVLLEEHGTVEAIFGAHRATGPPDAARTIQNFSERMMRAHAETPARLSKHLAQPLRGSAAKRLCMYMRWMVRPGPVDLGIWHSFDPRMLALPLDVHSGRQARRLGMLKRRSNDWHAVRELTRNCRSICPDDPARYDYAFFGLGISGGPPAHIPMPEPAPYPHGSSHEA